MNLLIYFLLAHFLADYPLQSGGLVRLKTQRYLGVFIHVIIHLVVMLLLLFPFLYEKKVWIAVAVIYVTHNIIDQTKVQLDKKSHQKARFFYFLDQFLHWSIIAAMAYYVGEITPNLTGEAFALYANQSLVLYIFCMILATYFYDVTRYFVRLKKNSLPYQRNYKTMLLNAVIVTLVFGVYWIAF